MKDQLKDLSRDLAQSFLEVKQSAAQDRSAETTHSRSEIEAVDALFAEGDRLLSDLAALEARAETASDLGAVLATLQRFESVLERIESRHCGRDGA